MQNSKTKQTKFALLITINKLCSHNEQYSFCRLPCSESCAAWFEDFTRTKPVKPCTVEYASVCFFQPEYIRDEETNRCVKPEEYKRKVVKILETLT